MSKMEYPKGFYAIAPGMCVVNSWSENVYGRWIKVFARISWNEVLIPKFTASCKQRDR